MVTIRNGGNPLQAGGVYGVMNAIRRTEVVLGLGALVLMMTTTSVAQNAAAPAGGLKNRSAAQAGTETNAALPAGAAKDGSGETAKAESLTVGNRRYDAAKELARLTKVYKLTDEQQTKIQAILLEQQKQVHALGEDESLSDRSGRVKCGRCMRRRWRR